MKNMKTVALSGAAIALLLMSGMVGARAEEGEPKSKLRWILKLDHGPLKTVAIRDGAGGVRYVHYMTMKITNDSGLSRQWVPQILAKTDTKKTYHASGNSWALNAIRRAERNSALVSISTAGTKGRIPHGATLDTVAIFGVVDPLYDHIKIQAFGLADPVAIFRFDIYGDDEIIRDSVYWDHNQKILKKLKAAAGDSGSDMPKPVIEYREVLEDRYFEMNYERLGDEFGAQDDKIDFVKESWKARGELKKLRVLGKKAD